MPEKDRFITQRNALLAKKIVQNLRARKFGAEYCETAAQAADRVLELIPEGSTVSWGGSLTLGEIGIYERLRRAGCPVIDRDTAQTPEERTALMQRAFLCDVYLTSFNAVSENGVLYNVDGVGNRVAAIAFGPKRVVAVVGMNKACHTPEDAKTRARTYASPINSHRSLDSMPDRKAPCVLTGACSDCISEDCICSHVVETRFCKPPGRIHVLLVGEPLGF